MLLLKKNNASEKNSILFEHVKIAMTWTLENTDVLVCLEDIKNVISDSLDLWRCCSWGMNWTAGHRARCGAEGWRREEKGFRAAQALPRFCLYQQDKATKKGQVTVATELGTRIDKARLLENGCQMKTHKPSADNAARCCPDFCNEPIPLASPPALSPYYLFVNYLLDWQVQIIESTEWVSSQALKFLKCSYRQA